MNRQKKTHASEHGTPYRGDLDEDPEHKTGQHYVHA